MEDYYRVKFRKLIDRTRLTRAATSGAPPRIEMPPALRVAYGASCFLSATGWVAVVVLGRASAEGFPVLLALSFPVWLVLYLGFAEQQAWTRPLVPALFLLASVFFWTCDLPGLVVSATVLAVASSAWLYGSPEARRYYALCRELATVRVSSTDLRGALLIPIYTSLAGALSGAALGYWLATRIIGYSSGLGANDVAGIVCAAVLLAAVLGVLGRWLGEALVSRLSRAA